MTAVELLADMARLGVRLEAHGNQLRYHPRSAVMPDLVEQLKARKPELLAILNNGASANDRLGGLEAWQATPDSEKCAVAPPITSKRPVSDAWDDEEARRLFRAMSERIADAYPAGWHWPAAPNDLDTADAAVRDAFQRRDLSCLRKAYVGFEQASLKAFVPMVDTIGGNVGAALTPEDLPNDWRLLYEERAAIAEYDGGLSREQAEAQALRDVVKAMERLHQPVAAVRAGGV